MADTQLIDILGRTITLLDTTWDKHILRRHPDMRTYRPIAEAAITTPTLVRESQSDANCRLYYGAGPRAGVMIVVVADIASGQVKTAHLAKKVTGGKQEWP